MTSAIFWCSHPGARWLSSFAQWTFEFSRHTSFRTRCEDRFWPPLAPPHSSWTISVLGVSSGRVTCGNTGCDVETVRRVPNHFSPKICDQILRLIGCRREHIVMMKWDPFGQHTWTAFGFWRCWMALLFRQLFRLRDIMMSPCFIPCYDEVQKIISFFFKTVHNFFHTFHTQPFMVIGELFRHPPGRNLSVIHLVLYIRV